MSRLLRAAMIVLMLASCGSRNNVPPRNMDDACAIIRERPQYFRAMQQAERKWGVPVHVQMATIYQESRFVGNARTPYRFALGIIPLGRQSSAYGYSQALDGTWDDYRSETRRRSAKRNRISDATDFMGWYMDNTERKLGVSKADATNQYLAYHEGHNGFARGSHKDKSWLLSVADKVGTRSDMYRQQLQACRR
ncbi:MAG: lytic transglycosylase [Paracoccaceae bacterium]